MALFRAGQGTVLARHTCRHRTDELLAILTQIGAPVAEKVMPA